MNVSDRGGGGGGGHGHLERDERRAEGDIERPATTHANLQIHIFKVRHSGRVGGGPQPSYAAGDYFESTNCTAFSIGDRDR